MTTSKPRILCISRSYGEHAGGMERLSFELISGMKNSDTFEVSEIVHETKAGSSLLSARLQSLVFAVSILPKAIRASASVDIVHLGDPVLSGIGWCVMRLRNIPVAVTVHGLDVSYSNPIYQLYLALFFRYFSLYIPISTYAQTLLTRLNVSGTITVIPPGIRDHLYDPSKTRIDLDLLLGRATSNMCVLATTGRLVERKGHAWFISHVLPRLPQNVLYAIAGNGPEASRLTHIVQSLNLSDRVILLGRISHDDQKTLINTCDAFIQPNILIAKDGEGFGIAPLEAALCGKPVFASNIDGIPSAIHHAKNGVLLPAQEPQEWISALTAFAHDTASFTPTSSHARTYTLTTFKWETVIAVYERAIQNILKASQ